MAQQDVLEKTLHADDPAEFRELQSCCKTAPAITLGDDFEIYQSPAGRDGR